MSESAFLAGTDFMPAFAPNVQPFLHLQILRSPAPAGNKIGAPALTGRTTLLQLMQNSKEPVTRTGEGRMFYNFDAVTLDFALPDIREQDRLQDPTDIDARTGLPALYIVKGVRTYRPSHLELWLQRQVGA